MLKSPSKAYNAAIISDIPAGTVIFLLFSYFILTFNLPRFSKTSSDRNQNQFTLTFQNTFS